MTAGRRRILLVGAGHAHLETLSQASGVAAAGAELVALSPGPFLYSGLATGVLGGEYPEALDRIDVAALAARGGGRHVAGALRALDLRRGRALLEDGAEIGWDALSIAVGSLPPDVEGADDPARCFAVKPIGRVHALRRELERRFAAEPDRPVRLAVAGGGATACEVALNAAALARRRGGRLAAVLLAGGGLMRQAPAGAARSVARVLDARGIEVRDGARVARVEADRAVLRRGPPVPFDLFVNATGLRPHPILGRLGLPLSDDGALRLDPRLRSPADERVHGGGDCAAPEGAPLARVGVHAIRQGPILRRNLLAAVGAGRPATYRPQRRWLWILNLGDRDGLAIRGALWWRGRTAWALKDRIDRRFLARYAT